MNENRKVVASVEFEESLALLSTFDGGMSGWSL